MRTPSSDNSALDTPSVSVISEIAVYETAPDSITWHKILDHELDGLTNISRPTSLAIATTASGAFVGLIPSAFPVLSAVSLGKPVGLTGLATLIAILVAFIVALVVGVNALKAQADTRKILKDIRSRAKRRV